MKICFLGTGTSHGVPMIGCECTVCRSSSKYNKRLRSSVLVSVSGLNILIDTSTDLRQQCLKYNITAVDGILFTHHHVDHIFGLDDTRPFNYKKKDRIKCFGNDLTIDNLRRVYSYIFDYPEIAGGVPMVELIPVSKPFVIEGIQVMPITIMHGKMPIFAYRIGDFVYATDCSDIPNDSMDMFKGCKVVVLDCLREKPHPTHFHLDQAISVAQEIGAKATYFTHISHQMDHEEVTKKLPENIYLAYDSLTVSV